LHLILLSGGSGKRLWPLSSGSRSKQFLELLRSDDGRSESMFQRVCRQLASVKGVKWDSVTVIAGEIQRDQLSAQSESEIDILIEPSGRDTFPAISYASAWLHSVKNIGKEEIVAIMPVDPFVDESFFEKIFAIESEILSTDANIILIGCKPDKPTEKFGYILVDPDENRECAVSSKPVKGFQEKPSESEAAELISKGALWNCGVFGMRLGFVLELLAGRYGVSQYDMGHMNEVFHTLSKISFDFEVVETAANVRVLEYSGDWKDLGTWESFAEEMSESAIGNVIANRCKNSHIINELDIPVVAVGMEDSVIVASHAGILVAKKDETDSLKRIVEPIMDRPVYEKRRWGEYLVLYRYSNEHMDTLIKKLILEQGRQISYQTHSHRKETWTIIRGEGVLYFEDEKVEISAGETVSIDIGKKHGLYAVTGLELIEVQFGYPLVEEDIIRLEYDWDPDIEYRI